MGDYTKVFKTKDIESAATCFPKIQQNKKTISIIALTGSSKQGKSRTLRLLITSLTGLTGSNKDLRILFTYQNRTILVCTMGDSRKLVEQNCLLAELFQPDIFVCAVNYNDGATQAFNYFCQKYYKQTFVQLRISKNEYNSKHNNNTLSQHQINQSAASVLQQIINNI